MKTLSIVSLLVLTLTLTACSGGDVPMTDAEMAENNGLTMEEYKEQKAAAARMNMTIEDHLKSGHSGHDM